MTNSIIQRDAGYMHRANSTSKYKVIYIKGKRKHEIYRATKYDAEITRNGLQKNGYVAKVERCD